MIQLRREWGRFSNFSFRTPQRRISAYPARPSAVEDVTPDRNFSPLCLAVPRLQSASEHGLVSEEAVFNARLLSVARLLLPLSSPDLANPLKSRVTLRPWAVRWPRRHRGATRGDHNHDVLCTGRAGPIVDRSVVVGPVRRETPDGNFDRGEKSVWRSGRPKTTRSVNAVRIARFEYRRCPPRRPFFGGIHAAIASSLSQIVTSPRLLRPRSYSLQFRILYFVLYWRLIRLDFPAAMTLPP